MSYNFSAWNSLLLQSVFPDIGAQGKSGLLMVELEDSVSRMEEVVPEGGEDC